MTSAEFKRVFRLAEAMDQHRTFDHDEYREAQDALMGFGVERKHATARQCAIILNAQTIQFNGVRSTQATEETRTDYLKNVTLID